MDADRALPGVPRAWWGIELPGYREPISEFGTYSGFGYDLPPIERDLDDDLDWLRGQEPVPESLAGFSSSPEPSRPANVQELQALIDGADVNLPPAFVTFVTDPLPRTRVRSPTACYLDLADSIVAAPNGHLIHFLSDQQWVLHWLLYIGRDGRQAVVCTDVPYGFVTDESPDEFEPGREGTVVCAESFSEFLYRTWIENEIWFARLPDRESRPLADEQRRYVEHYTS